MRWHHAVRAAVRAPWAALIAVLSVGCGDGDGGSGRLDGAGARDAGEPDGRTADSAPAAPPTITIRGEIRDFVAEAPVEALEVCVHDRPDVACARTAGDGAYALAGVPASSDLALSVRDDAGHWQPEIFPIHTPDEDIAFSPRAVAAEIAAMLGEQAGAAVDPSRSVLLWFASAGVIGGLAGVSAELVPDDAEARGVFTDSLSLSTVDTTTTRSGLGIFVNVPPGEHRVRFSYLGSACGPTPGSWQGDVPGELRAPSIAGAWVVIGVSGCAR